MRFELALRRIIILFGSLTMMCFDYGFTSRKVKALNFDESKNASDNPESCFGCSKDLDLLRSQYRLHLIKEKIQRLLHIDSDKPGDDITTLPYPMRDLMQDIFHEKDDEISETISEKQILLPEFGIVAKGRRRIVFHVPFRAASRNFVDLWLPQIFVRMQYCIKTKITVKGKTIPFMSKFIDKYNITILRESDGWLSLHVKDHLKDYVRSKYKSIFDALGASIVVDVTYDRSLSDMKPTLRPFMVVELTRKTTNRKRRNINCNPGVKSFCCREKLTVDFADIGLQQHIIEPKSFEAYHCVGKCGSYSRSATTRVDIIKSVMSRMRLRKKSTDQIKFCCTAARSSSQKLIYYNNDKTKIRSRTVAGLVVEECDCL